MTLNMYPYIAKILRRIAKTEWSKNSIVFNLFRLYELFAGRKRGVRIESRANIRRNEKGTFTVERQFYTLEAVLVWYEAQLVSFIPNLIHALRKELPFDLRSVRVYVPAFTTTNETSPYLFAVAYESSTRNGLGSGTNSPYSTSYSTSGSNRGLIVSIEYGFSSSPGDPSAITYNGVSMTQETSVEATNRGVKHYSLVNPASGSNTFACTYPSGIIEEAFAFICFSGVLQTDWIEAVGTATYTSATSGTKSVSVTTISPNALVFASWTDRNSDDTGRQPYTLTSSNSTQIYNHYASNSVSEYGYGVVGARSAYQTTTTPGVYTMSWTHSSTDSGALSALAIAEHIEVDDIANSDIATNLVSYWELESDGADSHGSNDLTEIGTSGSFVPAIQGNGVDIEEGSPTQYYISDASQSGLDITTSGSWSFWYKPESITSTQEWIINKYITSGNDRGYGIALQSGNIFFYQGTSDGAGGESDFQSYTFTNGNWYHIVLTYDSGDLKYYVNGSLVGTDSAVSPLPNVGTDFYINRAPSGGNGMVDGVLDGVGVWNRALYANQVSALYGGGSGLPYSAISASPISKLMMLGVS